MKKLFIIWTSALALTACQTPQPKPTGFVDLNKTSVYSWHLGQNTQGQNYLLIVLNQATLNTLQQKGDIDLNLGQQTFKNASQVQSGFLVLNPLPADWDERKITQLLN